MGLLSKNTFDKFIDKNGDSITRKRATSKVFDTYHGLDFDNTTWSDVNSKMVLEPETKMSAEVAPEGVQDHGGTIRGQVLSDLDIKLGDFVFYNNEWYRVLSVSTDTFKGITIKHIEIRFKEI